MFRCERHQAALISCVDNTIGRTRAWSRWALSACLLCTCSPGCGGGENIGVDLSADAPRFLIHRPTLGWPFRWTMVDAFVIASEEDGAVWELRSTDPAGLPARRLAIIYGQVPSGFYQVLPSESAAPAELRAGRLYYVGATGPKVGFRTVFALPIRSRGSPGSASSPPRSEGHDDRPSGRAPQAKAAD